MRAVALLAAVLVALAALWWLQSGPAGTPAAGPLPSSERGADHVAPQLSAGERRADVAVAGAFVVAVRDEVQQAIGGASIELRRSGSVVAAAVTDRHGDASLGASDEPAELRVSADSFFPVVTQVPVCRGRVEVVLGQGTVLDGVVLVDGAPPVEPLSIQVMSGEDRTADLAVRTGAGGLFAVRGVPAQWSGRLVFPRRLWITSHPIAPGWHYSLELRAPQRGMRIELVQLPVVRARLVSAAGGKPVPGRGASVRLHAAGNSTDFGVRSDAEGRVEVEVRPDTPAELMALRSRDRAGLHAVEVQVDRQRFAWRGAEIPADLDLGDVRIDLGRDVHFLVVDAQAVPIPGAVVMADHKTSEPTDASGRTRVNVVSARPELECGAIGFSIGPVTVRSGTGEAGDPYRLALGAGNLLTIRVRDREGRVPPAVWLEIELDRSTALFGAKPGLPDSLRGRLGATSGSFSTKRGGGLAILTLHARANGDFLLPGIRPEVPLHVRAMGRIRSVLAERHVLTPAATSSLVVDLVVEARRCRIAGRVLTPDGAAATGARVYAWSEGSGPNAEVDAHGRFAIDDVYAVGQSILLEANHARYALLLRELAQLTADVDLDLQLAPSCTVEATIADASGQPVDGVPLAVRSPRPLPIRRTGPGTFRVEQLAAGPCELVCTIGGQEFTLRHDAAVATARLTVPAVGRLEVIAPEAWAEATEPVTVELTADGRRHTIYLSRDRGALRHTATLLPGTYSAVVLRRAVVLARQSITVLGGEKVPLRLER